MNLTDTYDRFATQFNYPIERETLIGAAGTTEIEAPTGRSETIAEILERTSARTFQSPRELHEALLAHVGEQYIGRKFYDDRGLNPGRTPTETI